MNGQALVPETAVDRFNEGGCWLAVRALAYVSTLATYVLNPSAGLGLLQPSRNLLSSNLRLFTAKNALSLSVAKPSILADPNYRWDLTPSRIFSSGPPKGGKRHLSI